MLHVPKAKDSYCHLDFKDIPQPDWFDAHSLVRCPGGWSHVKLSIYKDGRVEVTASQPDLKSIAFEAFKIAVVKSNAKMEG